MASINLTARELELLSAVVDITKAEIDWTKVAERANMNTSKYARDKWAQVRTKIISNIPKSGENDDAADGGATMGAANGTKATPRKRKNGAGDGEDGSPARKKTTPRKGKKAATEAVAAETEGQDDEEIAAVKAESEEDGGG